MINGALVIGEALVDEIVDAGRFSRYSGGSPANVAIGLSRLNVATRLHTAIGDDKDGELIRRHLAESGVVLTSESTTSAPTSKAIATLSANGSAAYEFALSWDPSPLDDLGSPVVVHAGSLGAFLEPGADTVGSILVRGRAAGAQITFDPNIRPSLVGDPNRARTVFEKLALSSHVTKLSDEDAGFLLPRHSLHDVLDLLIDGGVPVVAITRGSEGAYLASGESRIEVPPVETVVADTVGAGDAFMATLIWALIFEAGGWDGQPISQPRLHEIGRRAALAAALTVSRPGADLPTRDELIAKETGVKP